MNLENELYKRMSINKNNIIYLPQLQDDTESGLTKNFAESEGYIPFIINMWPS